MDLESMNRRTFLVGLGAASTMALAGCLNFTGSARTSEEDASADAPSFPVRDDGSGGFVLLRIQPQTPNGLFRGDEYEIGVVVGNTASEPLTGEITVELVPRAGDGLPQPASITVTADNPLLSGAARFFRAGPFRATVVGEWELVAETNIAHVHSSYDGTVTVQPQPSD